MRSLLPEGPPPRLVPFLDRLAEWWARRTPRARSLLRVAVALAVAAVVLRPGGQPWGTTSSAWVATRDLPAGHVVAPEDLARRPWPTDLLPLTASDDLAAPVGTRLAVGLPAGSPLASWHLQAPGPADRAPPEHVAVALAAELLPPLPVGRVVDLHGADGISVHGAVVVEAGGDTVWLAVPRAAAGRLAAALAYGELLVAIVAATPGTAP